VVKSFVDAGLKRKRFANDFFRLTIRELILPRNPSTANCNTFGLIGEMKSVILNCNVAWGPGSISNIVFSQEGCKPSTPFVGGL
jgi:hypothetical protein